MTAAPPQLKVSLQPKQFACWQACTDLEGPTVIGFGGSRGAAKSGGVRRIALALAMQRPGIIVWIMRRVWDDLNKDHVKPLFLEYPELKDFWHAGDKELRIPVETGFSSIFFIHAGDTGRAKRKARGPQAHYIFLEQAEEFSQQEMEQLAGSNRAPGVAPGFCKRIYTFNPGGIGTNYLRRIFWNRNFHDNEDPNDYMFIQGFGWDNYEWFRGLGIVSEWDFYHSPEWNEQKRFQVFIEQTDFGRKLNSLPASQRIGELMGSFENFSGQYYAEVWQASKIVLPVDLVSRIIQPWWRRWLSTDWGFSHYAATGWFASGLLAPDKVLEYFGIEALLPVRVILQYRELVCNDVPEPDMARLIASMTPRAERQAIKQHFIGHDAWAKRGSAKTIVEQMDPILVSEGLKDLTRADIDRMGGWRLLYNCWATALRLRDWKSADPFRDAPEEQPALFISSACPETVSSIPLLIADKDNPQDIQKMPGEMSDDVADMVRYGVKSYMTAEPKAPREVTELETYQRYEDPTARAMAMLKLRADNDRGQYLRRRPRA